ncbi:MAG: hypothetical protein LLG97_09205 [Deltaproteobacteria bacterium]|nr:hypothetical protein [Deltaproteobacteria bacterium]
MGSSDDEQIGDSIKNVKICLTEALRAIDKIVDHSCLNRQVRDHIYEARSLILRSIEDASISEEELESREAEEEILRRQHEEDDQTEENGGDVVNQICDYWVEKSNDELEINYQERNSIKNFLSTFDFGEITNAIDISFSRSNIDLKNKFKYMCGVLYGKQRAKSHSPEFSEILKYWNFKRPHSWEKADEGKLDYILTKYDTTKIKYYIDRVIDDEKGWSDFDSIIRALEENRYE